MLQIDTNQAGPAFILALTGSFDTKTSKQGEDAFGAAMDAGHTKLVVDFVALDYISSVGLRALLHAMKRLKKAGGTLHLCGMNPTVYEVFEISGFTGIFKIFPTLAEATAGL